MTPQCHIVEWSTPSSVTEWGESNVVLMQECRTVTGTLVRSHVPSPLDNMDVPAWGVGTHITMALLVLVVGLATLIHKEKV